MAPRLQQISNESMKKTEGGLLAEKGSKDPKKKAKGRSSTTMGLKEAQTISQLLEHALRTLMAPRNPQVRRRRSLLNPHPIFFLL